MNRLDTSERARSVSALVKGCRINAIYQMMGISKPTVLKLLADLGKACLAYHDAYVRNLSCKRIQCDEIWSFAGAKMKNASEEKVAQGSGDVWTWTALDADSKLMVSYFVGQRGPNHARFFMEDVASRINSRVQITTDGHRAYVEAIEGAFGMDVDYAMLIKLYGNPTNQDSRYSPSEVIGTETEMGRMMGDHVSTSFMERQNLTMRMSMRRFTRLTNGFSKKADNHEAAIALHYMHYNFCRVHQTLRVTPAMKAGIANHVWSIKELISMLQPQTV